MFSLSNFSLAKRWLNCPNSMTLQLLHLWGWSSQNHRIQLYQTDVLNWECIKNPLFFGTETVKTMWNSEEITVVLTNATRLVHTYRLHHTNLKSFSPKRNLTKNYEIRVSRTFNITKLGRYKGDFKVNMKALQIYRPSCTILHENAKWSILI